LSKNLNGFFFLCSKEQERINEFLSGFETDLFTNDEFIPEELNVPDSRVCDYMVHCLCKVYGYKEIEAWQCFELEFVRMKAFKSLEGKQKKHLMNKK